MLLNILQCTEQTPTTKIIQPQTSIELRLRNAEGEKKSEIKPIFQRKPQLEEGTDQILQNQKLERIDVISLGNYKVDLFINSANKYKKGSYFGKGLCGRILSLVFTMSHFRYGWNIQMHEVILMSAGVLSKFSG